MLVNIFLTALQTENPENYSVANYPSVTALFFRIILTLIFVVLITYIVLRIIKRQQNLQRNQKEWVKVLDYQALGTNRGLYLMELYGLVYIVAVCDGQISILKEIQIDNEKWEKTKNSLLESEDIVTKGIERLFKKKDYSLSKKDNFDKNNFQQQLAEQFRKNKHLSQDVFRGRDRDDK